MLDGRAREYINAIRRLGGVYFRNTKSRCPFFYSFDQKTRRECPRRARSHGARRHRGPSLVARAAGGRRGRARARRGHAAPTTTTAGYGGRRDDYCYDAHARPFGLGRASSSRTGGELLASRSRNQHFSLTRSLVARAAGGGVHGPAAGLLLQRRQGRPRWPVRQRLLLPRVRCGPWPQRARPNGASACAVQGPLVGRAPPGQPTASE